MARPLAKVTAQIENFIRAEARGENVLDIRRKYFGITPESTESQIHSVENLMSRWRKRPEYKQIWDDELAATVRRYVPGAVGRIMKQIDGNNDWLSNKAANDVITLAKTVGLIQSSEQAVKVQIEGMPDLGSPDDNG